MAGQEQRLFVGVHWQAGPGQNHAGLRFACLALLGLRLGIGQNTARGLRPGFGEIGAHRGGPCFNRGLFALSAQVIHAGPVIAPVQEIHILGIAAPPRPQAVPFDHIRRDQSVARRDPLGGVPIARAHGIHRPAQRARTLGLRGRSGGKKAQQKRCQTCDHLHFLSRQG